MLFSILFHQRLAENFVHRVDEDELDFLFDDIRNISHIAFIFFRQQYLLYARPVSSQDLFLYATYRQYRAAQRDFTSHGQIMMYSLSSKG